MKKFISLIIMLLVMPAVNSVGLFSQGLPKEEVKRVKKHAKEMVKEGWKVQGASSLESKLLEVRAKEYAGDVLLVGAALDGYKKSNTALSHCKNNAVVEYTQMTGNSIIKGRVTSQVSDMNEEETDNLVDMAEQNFIKELKGELGMPVLKLTKQDPKTNLWSMQCWWVLNENKMEKIRESAITRAMADAEDASRLGEKISDFINAGSDVK